MIGNKNEREKISKKIKKQVSLFKNATCLYNNCFTITITVLAFELWFCNGCMAQHADADKRIALHLEWSNWLEKLALLHL
jgi:hypothetical protein